MRARLAVVVLVVWLAAEHAGAAGFFTQKELVGCDGDTLVVVPPLTFVVADQRFGEYVRVSYQAGEDVCELRVRQADLKAARPDEKQATQSANREKLQAFYRERVPFDISIAEFRDTGAGGSDDKPSTTSRYRMRITTRSLLPAELSNIRFEVHVFLDAPREEPAGVLWQLRIMSAKRCEFKTAETPLFSVETLRSSARQTDGKSTSLPAAGSDGESVTATSAPRMRFAVRLFVDEMFIDQKTGVVEQTGDDDEELSSETGPSSSVIVFRNDFDPGALVHSTAQPSR